MWPAGERAGEALLSVAAALQSSQWACEARLQRGKRVGAAPVLFLSMALNVASTRSSNSSSSTPSAIGVCAEHGLRLSRLASWQHGQLALPCHLRLALCSWDGGMRLALEARQLPLAPSACA